MDTRSIPRPGRGIAEYREVTRQAHRAVDGVVDSLETLAQGSGSERQLAQFDRAFEQLELTSVQVRARAEAIIARGQNYFDEWKEHLNAATIQPATRAEIDRYQGLFQHFTRIRQRSSEVREEFRPFMASLRQFRARLDQPFNSTQAGSSPAEIAALTASGRRVLKILESVSEALNRAETELHTMRPAKQ
ncbi:MAG: hypothetical protein L0Y58_21600 [Verrucomicrobia subdivision 3 bacterium]|nr:hypothetical protein [Limisphaerales bacterium]